MTTVNFITQIFLIVMMLLTGLKMSFLSVTEIDVLKDIGGIAFYGFMLLKSGKE